MWRNSLNKKITLFIILHFSLIFADEFVVAKFFLDEKDLSARIESKTDVNDEFCAIIKIRTDLDNLKFHSNQLEDVVIKNNEYWLYVSPGIQQVNIMKSGFITKTYSFSTIIKSTNVYILEMTNKEQTQLNVVSMPTNSIGAEIFINGKFSNFKTPNKFKMLPGKYIVTLQHKDFLEMTKEITLNEMETRDLIFYLSPYEGSKLQKFKYYKKQKRIGIVTAIFFIGAGYGFNYLAEEAYDKSQKSKKTSEVDDYWDSYKQYKSFRDISYSVSVLPLIYGAYNFIKEMKYKR